MREGWYNDDYWSLCEDQNESARLTATYDCIQYLPGYSIVGLKGWDDFILSDCNSQYFLVPTVPLDPTKVEPFCFPTEKLRLQSDDKLRGKIKWYTQPILFGGSPSKEENLVWLSQDEHAEAVRWWNKFYHDTFATRRKV